MIIISRERVRMRVLRNAILSKVQLEEEKVVDIRRMLKRRKSVRTFIDKLC